MGDPNDTKVYRVPNSSRSFHDVEIHDLKHIVDWFPDEHPPLPAIVAAGRGTANAFGYCHLADGNGRPENSARAGLPADYIKRQVAAFADGTRRMAIANAVSGRMMTATAKGLSPSEMDPAATYFSKLHYASHVQVVETKVLGFRAARFIYVLDPAAKQEIGDRIIEVPSDPGRFELRDPHIHYTAYVPTGSVAAGRTIAMTGGPAAQPRAACHGAGLRGGVAPPLAGRSPTMVLRQLAALSDRRPGKPGGRTDAHDQRKAQPEGHGGGRCLCGYAQTLTAKVMPAPSTANLNIRRTTVIQSIILRISSLELNRISLRLDQCR